MLNASAVVVDSVKYNFFSVFGSSSYIGWGGVSHSVLKKEANSCVWKGTSHFN